MPDLRELSARDSLLRLLDSADVLLDCSCGGLNETLGLDRAALAVRFPALITARRTPFGDDGPWKDFKASDLIDPALGGVMMIAAMIPIQPFTTTRRRSRRISGTPTISPASNWRPASSPR